MAISPMETVFPQKPLRQSKKKLIAKSRGIFRKEKGVLGKTVFLSEGLVVVL